MCNTESSFTAGHLAALIQALAEIEGGEAIPVASTKNSAEVHVKVHGQAFKVVIKSLDAKT